MIKLIYHTAFVSPELQVCMQNLPNINGLAFLTAPNFWLFIVCLKLMQVVCDLFSGQGSSKFVK